MRTIGMQEVLEYNNDKEGLGERLAAGATLLHGQKRPYNFSTCKSELGIGYVASTIPYVQAPSPCDCRLHRLDRPEHIGGGAVLCGPA
jgi:hypothetical protein